MSTAADPTSTTEQLVRELYRLGASQRQWFRRAATDLGLGTAALSVLGALARRGDSRVSELAADIAVDLSVASRQVSALEADGLVARTADPADRRAQLVALTGAGHELLDTVHARLVAAFGDVVGAWTDAEVAALAASLGRLRENLEGECK